MKKMLLFAVILVMYHCTFAQSGALTIINNNPTCTLHINVMAVDANLGNNFGCDLAVNFVIPPSSSVSFSDPSFIFAAGGGPGWNYVAVPSSFTYANMLTELGGGYGTFSFAWTDCSFQFQCPDCGEGSNMREVYPGTCTTPHCLLSGGTTWTAGACSYLTGGSWSSPGACVGNDVTITLF